jgi:hypothetical protein
MTTLQRFRGIDRERRIRRGPVRVPERQTVRRFVVNERDVTVRRVRPVISREEEPHVLSARTAIVAASDLHDRVFDREVLRVHGRRESFDQKVSRRANVTLDIERIRGLRRADTHVSVNEGDVARVVRHPFVPVQNAKILNLAIRAESRRDDVPGLFVVDARTKQGILKVQDRRSIDRERNHVPFEENVNFAPRIVFQRGSERDGLEGRPTVVCHGDRRVVHTDDVAVRTGRRVVIDVKIDVS